MVLLWKSLQKNIIVHQVTFLNVFIEQLYFGIADDSMAIKIKNKAVENNDKKMREMRI